MNAHNCSENLKKKSLWDNLVSTKEATLKHEASSLVQLIDSFPKVPGVSTYIK